MLAIHNVQPIKFLKKILFKRNQANTFENFRFELFLKKGSQPGESLIDTADCLLFKEMEAEEPSFVTTLKETLGIKSSSA